MTPCDAYENFPPPAFRPLQLLARIPGATYPILQSMRLAPARRLPIAFGWVTKRADDELTRAWMQPAISSRKIRGDAAAVLRGIAPRYTLEAAQRFGSFDKPVLIAWAPEDRFFKMRFAERLAREFPHARLELIEDSYAFVPIDQPERTASLVPRTEATPTDVATGSRCSPVDRGL